MLVKKFSQSNADIKQASDMMILLATMLQYIENIPQTSIGDVVQDIILK